MTTEPTRKPPRYHHGNLRDVLLVEARTLLTEQGIEGLSLRRLAERAKVSRTAPYHHFADKHSLLCAIALQGFEELQQLLDSVDFESQDLIVAMKQFVQCYLRFATEQSEVYDLMFGRLLWKHGEPTPELKAVAYSTFRHYVNRVDSIVRSSGLVEETGEGTDTLRLAQANWATLHGISRLMIDGIYIDPVDMDAVSQQAVDQQFGHFQNGHFQKKGS